MTVLKGFLGYHKAPTEVELLKLLSILNYAKSKFGISYSGYVDGANGPVAVNSRTNAENKKIMSAAAYAAFTRKVHRRLVVKDSETGAFKRLNDVDAYMRPLIADIFPDIGSFWGIGKESAADSAESLLLPHAARGGNALLRLMQTFQRGGHIYRYAKNSGDGHSEDPRLAIGWLSLDDDGVDSYLRFEVRYRVDSDQDLNDAYDSVISGRVMQINSFFVFIGVERDKGNPFFMVMKTALSRTRFKGLILRKHPKKSYFASRVMLASDIPQRPLGTSKIPASELPEVSSKQLDLIMNVATNGGRGILMLDED